MQHPGTYDLLIYKGATYRRTFLWREAGVIVNLAGYTARMQIRETREDIGTPYLSYTSPVDLVIDEPAGTVFFEIPDDVSTAWTWDVGFWDMELVSPGGIVYRFLEGRVIVDQEVTK